MQAAAKKGSRKRKITTDDSVGEKKVHCSKCGKISNCKSCSGCGIASYCGRKCKNDASADHEENCQAIKKFQKKVRALERPLHRFQGEDLFLTEVGFFWALVDPRNYCRARHSLAQKLVEMGTKEDNKLAYEEGLSHYLELMRLSYGDNQGVRNRVPFLLVTLNRLEDCYGFIKWWATIDPDGRYNWGNPPDVGEGEWSYLKDQDMMEDIFLDPRVEKQHYFNTGHLLALILIKILIIQKLEKQLTEAQNAFLMGTDEKFGKNSPVLKIVENWQIINTIFDHMKKDIGISQQEALLEKFCVRLDKINPRILKAVAKPEPLMTQNPISGYSVGSAAEAYYVLSNGLFVFQKTGADKKIKEIYGENPEYDHFIIRY